MVIITREQLKKLVKESVREVLNVELMKTRASLLGFVLPSEQKDIEKRYKKPSRRVVRTYTLSI